MSMEHRAVVKDGTMRDENYLNTMQVRRSQHVALASRSCERIGAPGFDARVRTSSDSVFGLDFESRGELEPHLPAGHRSSIAFMISSAHRTASAMALSVAGTLFPPSNCASFRAARILAAINEPQV